MKHLKVFTIITLSILVIFFSRTSAKTRDGIEKPRRQKSWTILIFMNGDNNLESSAIDDINEMERAVDTTLYNVIVTIDRIPGYDNSNGNWTTTRDYYITYDSSMDRIIRSYLIWDLGEMNMGDPYNFIDFVTYYMGVCPADHYLVILWDHGDGWYKHNSQDPLFKGIGPDVTNNDYLGIANAEYWWALDSISSYLGTPIDILAHDACLMGMHEVGYETFFNVDIVVFSEHTEPLNGYPYTNILAWLNSNSNATPSQFASTIVDKYVQSYKPGGSQFTDTGSITQSAVFAGVYLDNLCQKIDSFASLLMDAGGIYQSDIYSARFNSQMYYGDSVWSYVDLYDFALKIKNSGSLPSGLKQYADVIMNTVNNVVIAEGHYTAQYGYPVDNSHGLSIYYPYDPMYLNYNYTGLWFPMFYINWWYFLQGYSSIQEQIVSIVPSHISLSLFPNPTKNQIALHCSLPVNSKVSIKIFDITGRAIKTIYEGDKKVGNYKFVWDGTTDKGVKVPSGSYFCKIKTGETSLTKKITLIR